MSSGGAAAWERGIGTLAALLDAAVWSPQQLDAELGGEASQALGTGSALVLPSGLALLSSLSSSPRATVFAGVELDSGAPVAVKVLLPTPALAEHRAELERERALLERLVHPNVVELRGAGLAGGLAYLATRRAMRGSLDRWLGSEPSLVERLELLRGACAALEAAAALELCHGDLKPQNLLVSAAGAAVVCDWGSAGSLGEAPREQWCTALFAAPERGSKGVPSLAADIFALGLCLAFAVRGSHLFPEPARRGEAEAWQAAACEELPAELAALVRRCLAARPQLRPSASELNTELSALQLELERARGCVIVPDS